MIEILTEILMAHYFSNVEIICVLIHQKPMKHKTPDMKKDQYIKESDISANGKI